MIKSKHQQTAPNSVIQLRLTGDEASIPTLFELTNFFYDFNLVYEIGRLATDPKYEGKSFSRHALYRNGRPLEDQDRLLVRHLRQESPLALVAEIAGIASLGVGAVWVVVQTIEKISNWRLNREKLKEELKKLRRENEAANAPVVIMEEEQATVRLRQKHAVRLLDNIDKRLAGSAIKVRDLDITVERRTTRRSNVS